MKTSEILIFSALTAADQDRLIEMAWEDQIGRAHV